MTPRHECAARGHQQYKYNYSNNSPSALARFHPPPTLRSRDVAKNAHVFFVRFFTIFRSEGGRTERSKQRWRVQCEGSTGNSLTGRTPCRAAWRTRSHMIPSNCRFGQLISLLLCYRGDIVVCMCVCACCILRPYTLHTPVVRV